MGRMAQVRPSAMYSEGEVEGEGEGEGEKPGADGGLVQGVLAFISLVLILLTFPLSIWQCVRVSRVLSDISLSGQVAQEYERVVIFRLGRVRQGGAR